MYFYKYDIPEAGLNAIFRSLVFIIGLQTIFNLRLVATVRIEQRSFEYQATNLTKTYLIVVPIQVLQLTRVILG
jgi:hypothetical protein